MQKSIRRLALILCASAFALASTAQAGVAETGLKNFKLDMAKASVQKELNPLHTVGETLAMCWRIF